MTCWHNDKLTKYKVDKMASWWNAMLTKWKADKTASWWNLSCQNVNLAKWLRTIKCDGLKNYDDSSPEASTIKITVVINTVMLM